MSGLRAVTRVISCHPHCPWSVQVCPCCVQNPMGFEHTRNDGRKKSFPDPLLDSLHAMVLLLLLLLLVLLYTFAFYLGEGVYTVPGPSEQSFVEILHTNSPNQRNPRIAYLIWFGPRHATSSVHVLVRCRLVIQRLAPANFVPRLSVHCEPTFLRIISLSTTLLFCFSARQVGGLGKG